MRKRSELPTEVPALQDLVLSLDQRVELLAHQIELLKRRVYGPTSEKRQADNHPLLPFMDLPAAPAQPEALQRASVVPKGEEKSQGHGRRKLPPELRRERIEYHPPEAAQPCPCCGGAYQRIGEEVSEQLEFIPASFFVLEHARVKYACPKCKDKVVIGAVPSKLLDKGLAGPGLLADLIVNKLYYHLPLYRQELMTEHLGWTLARSTQCQWLGACAERLEPLYLVAKADVLASHRIHTDDTPVRVLDPGAGKTKESRFWAYVGDDDHPQVVFDYTPSRKREGPAQFLKDFAGVLQADAYGGYDGIYAGGKVTEAGCWAHARRKFDEAQVSAQAAANEMLDMVGELYAVEKLARLEITWARSRPEAERAAALREAFDKRLKQRREHSAPVIARIKEWLERHAREVLPQSPLGKAVHYMRAQWKALLYFLEDGAVEIDNNAAENALRPIALGRKNWLFLGSDEGGRRAAILYSLIESCKRHGLDPYDYLRDVLVRIETQPPGTLRELLPLNWKLARETLSVSGP